MASRLFPLLALCLSAFPARAAERFAPASDAPTRTSARLLRGVAVRAPPRGCPGCFLRERSSQGARLSIKRTPALVVLNLVLKIDEHLYAPGQAPSALAASGVLRLSLLPPASPLSFHNRQPQEVESLAAYVLELGELGIVATARQQGRGGLWAELEAGEYLSARAVGFLTQRGSNATGAFWFGSHQAQLKVAALSLPARGDPVLFAFLSLQNDLTRDTGAFQGVSALPGLGLGVSSRIERLLSLTARIGFNVGAWLDLRTSESRPGYALSLFDLRAQL
jgi:hypothetical protein